VNQLVTTSDGSHTIYIPEMDEHYHSTYGAVQESEHVFLKNGFDFCQAAPLHIFEAGFGTGLNALLAAIRSFNGNREVFYTSIEKYPLEENITGKLNHYRFAGYEGENIFRLIHSAEWGQMKRICRNFSLRKIKGDLTTDIPAGPYDLIFFDAFAPDKQPEMWTEDIFKKISEITQQNGVFVTYSVKGYVKRNLKAAGFLVTRLPGPPGKRQVIRAIKI